MGRWITGAWEKVKKTGADDPRRVVHSMKVGLALTVVSIIYYVNPMYDGFGVSTVWALITVVFVMEFTVGGTLSKGLNRAFATLVAGGLGVGAHYLAILSGEKGEPFLLGCFVFLLGAAATFSRFIPDIKTKFDYGVLIFILTFSLVAVSSYRLDDVVEFAHQRLSTIAIGGGACMIIGLVLFPVWAGGDLHDLVAKNIEKLASYLEGLASEYFDEKGGIAEQVEGVARETSQAYKSVLNTKATEETLANLARWEPGHGCFRLNQRWEPGHGCFRLNHPWKQYLKVGALARQTACYMESLDAHISKPHLQGSSDYQKNIKEACREMSSECGKALKELSCALKMMVDPSKADAHIARAAAIVETLATISLESDSCLARVLHGGITASILTEIVTGTQSIAKSVKELARLAKFKKEIVSQHRGTAVNPISDGDGDEETVVVITVEK